MPQLSVTSMYVYRSVELIQERKSIPTVTHSLHHPPLHLPTQQTHAALMYCLHTHTHTHTHTHSHSHTHTHTHTHQDRSQLRTKSDQTDIWLGPTTDKRICLTGKLRTLLTSYTHNVSGLPAGLTSVLQRMGFCPVTTFCLFVTVRPFCYCCCCCFILPQS